MAIDPAASGSPSTAHIPLPVAGDLARKIRAGNFAAATGLRPPETAASRNSAATSRTEGAGGGRTEPHTPIRSSSADAGDPGRWDGLLNRLGTKYNVPPLFLKAVMLAESGGDPKAVGDDGHSVGLFQLHDRGYGHGMGDSRFDPEVNADRAARGLGESWQRAERAGHSGERAVREAYDHTFNPGGGYGYQGDAVVRVYNRLLHEQGRPPLS